MCRRHEISGGVWIIWTRVYEVEEVGIKWKGVFEVEDIEIKWRTWA